MSHHHHEHHHGAQGHGCCNGGHEHRHEHSQGDCGGEPHHHHEQAHGGCVGEQHHEHSHGGCGGEHHHHEQAHGGCAEHHHHHAPPPPPPPHGHGCCGGGHHYAPPPPPPPHGHGCCGERRSDDGGNDQGPPRDRGYHGPEFLDFELSQVLGDEARGMTRKAFRALLAEDIQTELRARLGDALRAVAVDAAAELAEDLAVNLQLEQLIARRDKARKKSRAALLAKLAEHAPATSTAEKDDDSGND